MCERECVPYGHGDGDVVMLAAGGGQHPGLRPTCAELFLSNLQRREEEEELLCDVT